MNHDQLRLSYLVSRGSHCISLPKVAERQKGKVFPEDIFVYCVKHCICSAHQEFGKTILQFTKLQRHLHPFPRISFDIDVLTVTLWDFCLQIWRECHMWEKLHLKMRPQSSFQNHCHSYSVEGLCSDMWIIFIQTTFYGKSLNIIEIDRKKHHFLFSNGDCWMACFNDFLLDWTIITHSGHYWHNQHIRIDSDISHWHRDKSLFLRSCMLHFTHITFIIFVRPGHKGYNAAEWPLRRLPQMWQHKKNPPVLYRCR